MDDPYRRTARFYDTLTEPPNTILRKIALDMCRPREGMKVLEVGCGTGSNLSLYENAGCEVFGIDLSPAMLEVARQKLSEHADLRLGDAAQMPYTDDSFDLVTAFLTLHEMPAATRTAVMAEMMPRSSTQKVDFYSSTIAPDQSVSPRAGCSRRSSSPWNSQPAESISGTTATSSAATVCGN